MTDKKHMKMLVDVAQKNIRSVTDKLHLFQKDEELLGCLQMIPAPGQCFSGRTDSDNVAVLSAETVTVTGGTLRVEAEKSVHAVLGRVSLTNCGLYASGHSGNSAKTVSQTTGVEALQTLAQQSGVRTLAASGFADVRAENAYLQDVLTCTAAGLMTGTGRGRFSPEKPMTRAMLVTVLWRMAGSPAAQGNGGFTDLRADWYRAGGRLGRAERHRLRHEPDDLRAR